MNQIFFDDDFKQNGLLNNNEDILSQLSRYNLYIIGILATCYIPNIYQIYTRYIQDISESSYNKQKRDR